MSNIANETFGQARQGSVAAIIQILNEQLSASGIRTRAVVADGMLQILCEAAMPQQLEKETVVSRVRQILENISPKRISKVNINSRIVKEAQLLWLEEINRDPENALLWSEVITLKKPFFVKRWIRDRHLKPAGPVFRDISEPDPKQNNLSNKLMGSFGLAVLLLGALWVFRDELSLLPVEDADVAVTESAAAPNDLPPRPASEADRATAGNRSADTTPPTLRNAPESGPDSAGPDSAGDSNAGRSADAFAEAVRIANTAATDGQNAQTAAEWLELAARWQRASDLMAQIPSSSEQHAQATERVKDYAENSQSALAQAAAVQ